MQIGTALPPLVQSPLLIDDSLLEVAQLPLDQLLFLTIVGMFFCQGQLAALYFLSAIIQSRQLAAKGKKRLAILFQGLERHFVGSGQSLQGFLTRCQPIRVSSEIDFKTRLAGAQSHFFLICLGQLPAETFEIR